MHIAEGGILIGMNPVPVVSCNVFVEAAPPGTTTPFRFGINIQTKSGGPFIPLRIETLEEFMAITSVLQIPGGQLVFRPNDNLIAKQF
ncbi:MAG: hypothetical protein ABI972_28100 [Acidobacteriota bacterium]